MRSILLFLTLFCFFHIPVLAQTSSNIIDIDTRLGQGSNPVNFTVFKNKVYFYATDSIHGTELWVTDGNTTSLVADINPGIESCLYNYKSQNIIVHNCMQVIGDTLYFAATDSPFIRPSIYKFDGVNPPTKAFNLHAITYPSFNPPRKFIALDSVLYFVADISSGVVAIMSYHPINGSGKIINTAPPYLNTPLIPWKNSLLFCGKDSTLGFEIHKYDPITQSTKLMINYTSPGNTMLFFHQIFNNSIYLKASSINGVQLFVYDGDTTIKDISFDTIEGTSLNQLQNSVNPFCYYNNHLYYSVVRNGTRHIYKYDPATGKKSYQIQVKSYPGAAYLVPYKGHLYYDDSSSSIYDFNSTVRKLSEMYQLPTTTRPSLNHYIIYNDLLITAAFIDSTRGVELLVLHDSTLSIGSPGQEISSILYPNPATDNTYLDLELNEPQNLSVRISDINGRTVHTIHSKLYSPGKHTISLPMANMSPGTYLCIIIDEKNAVLNSTKLIKH